MKKFIFICRLKRLRRDLNYRGVESALRYMRYETLLNKYHEISDLFPLALKTYPNILNP